MGVGRSLHSSRSGQSRVPIVNVCSGRRGTLQESIWSLVSSPSTSTGIGGGGRPIRPHTHTLFPLPRYASLGYPRQGGVFGRIFNTAYTPVVDDLSLDCATLQGARPSHGLGLRGYTKPFYSLQLLKYTGRTRARRRGPMWDHILQTTTRGGNLEDLILDPDRGLIIKNHTGTLLLRHRWRFNGGGGA